MNQDNLFEQIKNAERNAEEKEVPGLDSVWSRVEGKLDNKVLAKQTQKWKYWAVAASVVALVAIGYEFLRPDVRPEVENNVVVAKDTIAPTTPNDAVVEIDPKTSVLKKEAPQILERSVHRPSVVAVADAEDHVSPSSTAGFFADPVAAETAAPAIADADKEEMKKDLELGYSRSGARDKATMANGRVFEARVVRSDDVAFEEQKRKSDANSVGQGKKQKPLLIVDGKPLTARNEYEYDVKASAVLESMPRERDTILHLEQPLYIINGVEYTEESLFGPNPTSPYAPLNLQEEGMTTEIYTGRQANKLFGEKGKNGVVVITTKNGKPKPKK